MIYITADVLDGLAKPFLQHVRDFDAKHSSDCHLSIRFDAPDASTEQMVDVLNVDPPLPFKRVISLAKIERMEQALHNIEAWRRAYPLTVFPEPDLKKAAEVLNANGMTLDAISAHCMRHVLDGLGNIVKDGMG